VTAPAPYVSAFDLLHEWGQPLGLTFMRLDNRGLPPTNLPHILPVIIATRIGGLPVVPVDNPTMVLDSYAPDKDSADALARKLQAALQFQLPSYMAADRSAWVKQVETLVGPAEADYDSASVARVTATYSITIRSRFNRPT
jgi:hypothetical protein